MGFLVLKRNRSEDVILTNRSTGRQLGFVRVCETHAGFCKLGFNFGRDVLVQRGPSIFEQDRTAIREAFNDIEGGGEPQ